MRLNADIVYENLVEYYSVEMMGYKNEGLTLYGPEFHENDSVPFRKNHLYIIIGSDISRHPNIEKGAVIVCLNKSSKLDYYKDSACFMTLNTKDSIFTVFNRINDIFRKYQNWDDRLNEILKSNADIDEMTQITANLFKNPLLVLDANFRVLSKAGYVYGIDKKLVRNEAIGDRLSLESLVTFMDNSDPQLDKHEPIVLNIDRTSFLCCNLYDMKDYCGSVSLSYISGRHKNGDDSIMQYFCEKMVSALKKNYSIISNEESVLKHVFENAVNNLPIDAVQKSYLENINSTKRFVCMVMRIEAKYAQIPIDYIIAKFNEAFNRNITFDHHAFIVSFLEVDREMDEFVKMVRATFENVIENMNIKAGMSSIFTDPYDARMYYSQAKATLENGIIDNPDGSFYMFNDYALMELIINAQSNSPLELYYTDGFKQLLKHDDGGNISYVNTLRVYLNNNMNITKTAADLEIHRSTFLERLARIEKYLGCDLRDPDIRLQLQIVLKAMEIKDNATRARS